MIDEKYGEIEKVSLEDYDMIDQVEAQFQEQYFSEMALRTIGNRMANKSNDFCRDENTEPIDMKFSGKLKTISTEGLTIREYTVLLGKIVGECTEYFKGNPREIAVMDGSVKRDSVKRWYSDGQVEFEKTYNRLRYWHKNGQLKIDNQAGEVTVWDDMGNVTKKYSNNQ